MRSLTIFCLAVLMPTFVIGAANGDAAQIVHHDWNRDGFIDKAELVQNQEEQSVALHVYFGRRGGGFNAPIIAPNFAGSTPMSYDPAKISLNGAKSIVVESSHIGIGRHKYEAQTIVAFRQGQMRVIGYRISNWDSLDPDAASSCDVNFNTGRAIVLAPHTDGAKNIRHRLNAVPIRNWKLLPELRGVCPLNE